MQFVAFTKMKRGNFQVHRFEEAVTFKLVDFSRE